jgi:taurine transport system permease protein
MITYRKESPSLAEAAHVNPISVMSRYRLQFLSLFSFVLMFGLWVALTGGAGFWQPAVSPAFLPSPESVLATFFRLVETGYQGQTLAHHIGISLFRFSFAFAFCVIFGTIVGMAMGMSESIKALLDPPIEITRPIPKIALLPLLIIWFGIGEVSKILIIILSVFPLMSISAMQAIRAVNVRKLQAAHSLGATRSIIFWRILLPASLPGIFTGIRVSLGISVTMLVAAEMIATSNGIAWMALSAADFVQTNVVLVAVILMALLGYGLDQIARRLERRFVHWSGKDI